MNENLVFKKYCELARKNNVEANYYLGLIYEKGIGVDVDYDIAKAFFQKAADTGHKEAMLELIIICDYLDEYLNLEPEARIMLRKSILGDHKVMSELGASYYLGVNGCPKNINFAIKWLEESSKYHNQLSLYLLGNCYEEQGKYKKAFLCYYESAQLNYPPAIFLVGKCYLIGLGCEQNLHKSIKWLKKAALKKEEAAIILLEKITFK